jgi:hypothetical protein
MADFRLIETMRVSEKGEVFLLENQHNIESSEY